MFLVFILFHRFLRLLEFSKLFDQFRETNRGVFRPVDPLSLKHNRGLGRVGSILDSRLVLARLGL
jgi:hypothetical protein